MTKPRDGGPAFPIGLGLGGAYLGMTLRDYFAGQALVALVNYMGTEQERSERAYRIADAMIAARDGGTDEREA
jgi:hypothetical protein